VPHNAGVALRCDGRARLLIVADWHPPCYQRATGYVTDPYGRLLVFDHIDSPASGTQVAAGGIHDGESAEEAVVRELAEESGLESASIIRKLGETWYMAELGNVPAGLEEQIQHAFHLCVEEPPEDEVWEWEEKSGGDIVLHRFAFRWVSLEEAAALLWPVQAMWVDTVRLSLVNR
jgi:8-oxo-dGTP pyrophosphatase MutT (NUDIX family)